MACKREFNKKNAKLVELLLNHPKMTSNVINCWNGRFERETNMTALHIICKRICNCDINIPIPNNLHTKYLNIIKLMIDKGADINARNSRLRTPFFYVNNIDIAKLFLDTGKVDLESRCNSSRLKVFLAVEENNAPMVDLLLNHKYSNINIFKWDTGGDNYCNCNIFMEACKTGNTELVLIIYNHLIKKFKYRKEISEQFINDWQISNKFTGYILACYYYFEWDNKYKDNAFTFFQTLIDTCKIDIAETDCYGKYGSYWLKPLNEQDEQTHQL